MNEIRPYRITTGHSDVLNRELGLFFKRYYNQSLSIESSEERINKIALLAGIAGQSRQTCHCSAIEKGPIELLTLMTDERFIDDEDDNYRTSGYEFRCGGCRANALMNEFSENHVVHFERIILHFIRCRLLQDCYMSDDRSVASILLKDDTCKCGPCANRELAEMLTDRIKASGFKSYHYREKDIY